MKPQSISRAGTIWRPRAQRRWRSVWVLGSSMLRGERVFVVRRVPEHPWERAVTMTIPTLERYYGFARRNGWRPLDWGSIPYDAGVRFVNALGLDPREFGL